jgi:hypothetical protein
MRKVPYEEGACAISPVGSITLMVFAASAAFSSTASTVSDTFVVEITSASCNQGVIRV